MSRVAQFSRTRRTSTERSWRGSAMYPESSSRAWKRTSRESLHFCMIW